MTRSRAKSRSSRGIAAWCGANVHFVIAVLILAMSTGGWYAAAGYLDVVFIKKPVPWPERVEVNDRTFQNITFPKVFGPYEQAEKGELVMKDDLLQSLKIGTALDKGRVGDRQSNWYVCRVYVDKREKPPGGIKVWRLNVYYYTGVRDQVPHVPGVCLAAAGATIKDSSEKAFTASGCRPPWNEPVNFIRTHWQGQDKDTKQWFDYVQYHAFSMNDRPFNDRFAVRFKLMLPWIEHSYYAKIQFSPNRSVSDITKADAAAQEFVEHFLPHVVNALPTRETIEKLDAAS